MIAGQRVDSVIRSLCASPLIPECPSPLDKFKINELFIHFSPLDCPSDDNSCNLPRGSGRSTDQRYILQYASRMIACPIALVFDLRVDFGSDGISQNCLCSSVRHHQYLFVSKLYGHLDLRPLSLLGHHCPEAVKGSSVPSGRCRTSVNPCS